MNIQYLKKLEQHLTVKYRNESVWKNEGLSKTEIILLENQFNSGKEFPNVLRELLYLAGKKCYFLDYGPFQGQSRMQNATREYLDEESIVISRPFFAIDVYNGTDQCLFVYLDEQGPNPEVQCVLYEGIDPGVYIKPIGIKLMEYVNLCIDKVLSGRNPF